MKQGVILEVQEENWIVLSADGEFKSIPHQGSKKQVGDEVVWTDAPVRQKTFHWTRFIASVAAAVIFCFVVLAVWPNNSHASTLIYLDGNGSVEVEINNEFQVISVRALNIAASDIEQQLNWKGKNVSQFFQEWFQEAKKQRPNTTPERMVLSTFNGNKDGQEKLSQVEEIIHNIQSENSLSFELTKITVPSVVKAEVQKSGLSPARYAVWIFSQKEDQELTLQYISQTSVEELQKNEIVQEKLQNPPTEQDWKGILEKEAAHPTEDIPKQSKSSTAPENQSPNNQEMNLEGTEEDTSPTSPSAPSNEEQQKVPASDTTSENSDSSNLENKSTEITPAQ
ncbi:anti-sigma factor domain-containing protein [Risungbinella massiliensis]|uniref:anti-sigma factor domain-containing protein n=1 Tax=Risungbinella massiliensis TaxID=1329796 RepID=UPI0005CBD4B8|nr:anti-sigma factor domain-containing protein [Risungbinella massiliensis]